MNIFICGDLHGSVRTIYNFYINHIKDTSREQEENWILLLGDVGALYYLDERDTKFKQDLSKFPFKYFCVRGNHEERASNRAMVEPDLWEEVGCFGNTCLRQFAFPNIYYAKDEGGIYNIDGRKTLVLPGAYSVDKWYRIERGWTWFADEQLTLRERQNLEDLIDGQHFDLILSHTCPYSKMPTDLFLNFIDQSTVDNSMERWMDRLDRPDSAITYNLWCWGHFHADRIEAPGCEMFLCEIEDLRDIENRWREYDKTGKLDWWLPLSPLMKRIMED